MHSFLIIDDEDFIRTLLSNILKKNFICRITEAENGQVGLKALLNDLPDLIFLDISMPVMDGLQTLAAIRANAIHKKIPVIILTALSDKGNVGTLAQLGISDYIVKPIDIHDFGKRVKKVLSLMNSDHKERPLGANQNILLVEVDKVYREMIIKSFPDSFIFHEAANGTHALDIYSKFYPRYVLVSNRLPLLDKKIIMQKIKDISNDSEINIFLILDGFANISHKVFAFDGLLKWDNNPTEFYNEFEKIAKLNSISSSDKQTEC